MTYALLLSFYHTLKFKCIITLFQDKFCSTSTKTKKTLELFWVNSNYQLIYLGTYI